MGKRRGRRPVPGGTPGGPRGAFRPRAAALVAAGIAAGLLLAEGGARLAFRKRNATLLLSDRDLYYRIDRLGVRRHIPGRTGYERMWDGRGKAEFRINSLGFRGPDPVLPKPDGTRRILFLGDSITLGGRLPEDETFVVKTAKLLSSGGRRVSAVNAGVGDVGLKEEEETLRGPGMAVDPDLVVLFWYLNDGRPPVGFPEEIVYDNPALAWMRRRPWVLRSYLAGELFDRLRARLVESGLRRKGQNRRFEWIGAYNEGRWQADPEAFREMVRLARFDWGDGWDPNSLKAAFRKISELRAFVESRGAAFSLVILPLHAQVHARFSDPVRNAPQAAFGRFCAEAGTRCLDLLPELVKRADRVLFYDNCHYTPEGNTVVAELLAEFIRPQL